MKTTYTATFADGTTITRKTARHYGVAWRATWSPDGTHTRVETGFAFDRQTAKPYVPAPRWAHRGLSANERSKAKAENAEFLRTSGYAVEFAEARAA